jgi:hypothetical protein
MFKQPVAKWCLSVSYALDNAVFGHMIDTGDDRRAMSSRAVLMSVKWNVSPKLSSVLLRLQADFMFQR